MRFSPRLKQFFQASTSIVVLLAAWQIASLFFPHYLFPPVQDVLARTVKILFNWPELLQVLETAGRIFAGLAGAFILGSLIAIPIGRYPKIESYINPFLIFLQGIPALSWVIVAIIVALGLPKARTQSRGLRTTLTKDPFFGEDP